MSRGVLWICSQIIENLYIIYGSSLLLSPPINDLVNVKVKVACHLSFGRSIKSLKVISHRFHFMKCLFNNPLRLSDKALIPVRIIEVVLRITGLAAVDQIVSYSPNGLE